MNFPNMHIYSKKAIETLCMHIYNHYRRDKNTLCLSMSEEITNIAARIKEALK